MVSSSSPAGGGSLGWLGWVIVSSFVMWLDTSGRRGSAPRVDNWALPSWFSSGIADSSRYSLRTKIWVGDQIQGNRYVIVTLGLAPDPAPGLGCVVRRGSFVLAPARGRRCDVSAGTGRGLFWWLFLGLGCPAFAFGLDALLGQRADRGFGQRCADPPAGCAQLVGELGDVQLGLGEVAGGIGEPSGGA